MRKLLFLIKLICKLPCELTIPFQDIDQRLMKTHVHKIGLKCWQEHYLYQATTGENQKFTRRQIININKWFLILYHGNKELKSTNTCNNTYEYRLYCPSLEARSGTELMVWPHLYGLQSRQNKPQQKAEQRVLQCLCGGGEQGMVSRRKYDWLDLRTKATALCETFSILFQVVSVDLQTRPDPFTVYTQDLRISVCRLYLNKNTVACVWWPLLLSRWIFRCGIPVRLGLAWRTH